MEKKTTKEEVLTVTEQYDLTLEEVNEILRQHLSMPNAEIEWDESRYGGTTGCSVRSVRITRVVT